MSHIQKFTIGILVSLVLVIGAAKPDLALAALSISSVTPNLVVNDIPNAITITGTDFAVDAQVKIGGSDISTGIALVTNRLSDTELLANLPAGFSPGVYTVYVVNPAETTSLPGGLTVVAPTPAATSTAQPFTRPQISVKAYSTSVGSIKYGQNFTLNVTLENSGGAQATSLQVSFTSAELLMLKNGGVISLSDLTIGGKINLAQNMTAAAPLSGGNLITVVMIVSYYDELGTPYTENFTLNLKASSASSDLAASTPTPTGDHATRLIISDYQTDLEPLEPGMEFKLELSIKNQGDLTARSVIMIVGGGSGSGSQDGTPGPGGIAGSGGDFTNFAQVGSSNVQSLGDIPAQSILEATQQMIVNVNTIPGVFPMRISFSYTDPEGRQYTDEQVITLLVYSLPKIDISFYQPVGDLYTYQANLLPIQVINIDRRSAVLSNLLVSSTTGTVENGQIFIGYLDTGGYVTLDTLFTPTSPGTADILVSVDYTDDFNQVRTISKTFTMNVLEALVEPSIDPTSSEFSPDMSGGQQETFWHKIWRFILGIFGLDSSAPIDTQPVPVEPENLPAPVYKPGKG
jgi:hypothetical protein